MSDSEKSLCEPTLHFHFVRPGDDENSENPSNLTACFEVSGIVLYFIVTSTVYLTFVS